MRKMQKLDEDGSNVAYVQDGKVVLSLWTNERKPKEDPILIEMSPGDALGLVTSLANAAKSAILRSLGVRR